MTSVEKFAQDADRWFAEHTPRDVDFMMPLTFMEVGTDQQFDFLCDWQRQIWEAGFLGAAWPTEFGGGGLTDAHQKAATAAMRRHNAPILLNAIGLSWAGPLILDIGTQAQKQRYIRGILSAEDIWCQGFSEPEHGSDLGNAQLRAVRDGEEYVLNGSKIWTTHGHYAKYMILLARTHPEAENKYAGLSFILTPMKVPGIRTQKIRKLTGEHGFTQTFFENARVPTEGLMGREGEGWAIAMRTLEYERGARGGQAGGYSITEPDPLAILDLAQRMDQLDDPVVQDRLLDFVIETQAIAMTQRRARLSPLLRDYPMGLALMDKLVKTEFAREINQYALSLQGPAGAYYVGDDNSVDAGWWQRNYLNAFSATIGGGTSQIQRNIIAEHVLGLPKSR